MEAGGAGDDPRLSFGRSVRLGNVYRLMKSYGLERLGSHTTLSSHARNRIKWLYGDDGSTLQAASDGEYAYKQTRGNERGYDESGDGPDSIVSGTLEGA